MYDNTYLGHIHIYIYIYLYIYIYVYILEAYAIPPTRLKVELIRYELGLCACCWAQALFLTLTTLKGVSVQMLVVWEWFLYLTQMDQRC